ncbi:MAG: CotH kinase family protein [Verrucomicrobiae bacterium]|nr:CotH kinase family protein [Verrucomicrobiae bacterium]
MRAFFMGAACLVTVAVMAQPAAEPKPAPPLRPALAWGSFTPNLPVVFLTVTNPLSRETPVPALMQLAYPPGSRQGVTNALPLQLRYHGATSLGFPKKSYRLSLSNAVPLLGMSRKSGWVLNAAYIDRSLMRHKLAYDIFRSFSEPRAPRHAADSRFVEVYLNQRYQGVYLLMERVDRQLLGLRPFHSNDFSHSVIYKAEDHAANFGQSGRGGFEQREPDPERKEYWRPLELFTRFTSSASPQEFWDAERGIAHRLDLGNAIDFHILVQVTANSDGITKNFLLARDGQESGPQTNKFFFVPWDYDGTFGRNWNATPYPHNVWLSNPLFDRLMQKAEYRQRFIARWKQLRAGPLAEATLVAMMDANVKTLGEAVQRNLQRWPTDRGGYPDRLTFEQDIEQMKTWLARRLQWLDQEIARRERQ